MGSGTETSRNSCVLETRGEPEESTGSPLDWKSRSELPDAQLGYKESNIGTCGGADPLQNGKTDSEQGPVMEKHRPSTTTERIDRTLSGVAR
jgi:hypothetical protein